MKIRFDDKTFDKVFDIYEFVESVFRRKVCANGKLCKVEVENDYKTLFAYFEREAHRISLAEIADMIGCRVAIIGNRSDGLPAICGIN